MPPKLTGGAVRTHRRSQAYLSRETHRLLDRMNRMFQDGTIIPDILSILSEYLGARGHREKGRNLHVDLAD